MVKNDKVILALELVSWAAAVLGGIVWASHGPAWLYGALFGLSVVLLLGPLRREDPRLLELLMRRRGGAWPPPLWPRVYIFALFVGALVAALRLLRTGELVPSLVNGLIFAVAAFASIAVQLAMERRTDR